MFQTKIVEKIKTHILCSVTFFQKSCCLWDNAGKYGGTWQATDNNNNNHNTVQYDACAFLAE